MQLYLDANAHVNMSNKVIKAMADFNSTIGGHGHPQAPSAPGRAAASAIEHARQKISELIGADSPNQIIFTSTCTQACEWVLEILKNNKDIKALWCSRLEHPAVKSKFQQLKNIDSKTYKYLNHTRDGLAILSSDGFNSDDAVICIHIQNEIGTIQEIDKVKSGFLVSDMSQTLGKIPLNVGDYPNLQAAVFGAHKFGGPVGVGFIYLKDPSWWTEFGSGSRYFFDRAGTPDVFSIVGAAVALEEALSTLSERYQKMINFRDVLERGLEDVGWEIIGQGVARSPNTTFVKVPNSMSPFYIMSLAKNGIHMGLGSACGALQAGPNPLMTTLGHGGKSTDYMRISQFGHYGKKEAEYVVEKIRVLSEGTKYDHIK